MCNSMTNVELERKANLRRITCAIFSISMTINGLGVVETEALACEDPLSEPMSASIADMGSKLRDALALLDKVRKSLEEESRPIEFSEEKLLNNEWMGLDTEVVVPGNPFLAPNLDERVETSVREQGTLDSYAKWEGIKRRFTHHKPNPEQSNAYDITRKAGMDMALTIFSLCPDTPERDKAIDAVDMAVMWANASIARHAE